MSLMKHLFFSHFLDCRELVARVILETLRSIPVPDDDHELSRVLAIISRLGEDSGMSPLFCRFDHTHIQEGRQELLLLMLLP